MFEGLRDVCCEVVVGEDGMQQSTFLVQVHVIYLILFVVLLGNTVINFVTKEYMLAVLCANNNDYVFMFSNATSKSCQNLF